MHFKSLFRSVCFFHDYVPPPYGGVNQFLMALANQMGRMGLHVAWNKVGLLTRACLFNASSFDADRLRRMRREKIRMVHRVDGPVGIYRGRDDGTDRQLWEYNRELADATVFQSEYSLRKHLDLGMEFRNPCVIRNACDPAIFHRRGRIPWATGRKTRLISVSWSDNLNKGAPTYQWLEDRLDWARFEYTFVGRTQIPFDRIKVIPPVSSGELAALLRAHDIFVNASMHESCSNALIEALTCGLPCVAVRSGANPELVGASGFLFDSAEEITGLLDRTVAEFEERQAAIAVLSLADVADRYLQVMGLRAQDCRL
jgi:glycosyltransferase involved in cell wall biosynthesis